MGGGGRVHLILWVNWLAWQVTSKSYSNFLPAIRACKFEKLPAQSKKLPTCGLRAGTLYVQPGEGGLQ